MGRRSFGRVRNWRLVIFESDDSLEGDEMVLRTSDEKRWISAQKA